MCCTVLLKVVIAFALLLVAVMLMIWFERKLIAKMQNRIGPNKAGPWGILQTLADGIKLFFKEDLVPDRSDRFVFKLAPYLSLVPAFLTFAIVPIGGNFRRDGGVVEIFGDHTFLQVVDAPIGIALLPRDVVDRGLRRDARRLVVGLEVSAARFGAGHGADGVLRGGARPRAWRRCSSRPAACRRTTSSPGKWATSSTGTSSRRGACRSSSSGSRAPPSSTGRRSISSRPSKSSSVGSTPSTARSDSPCSTWPSS